MAGFAHGRERWVALSRGRVAALPRYLATALLVLLIVLGLRALLAPAPAQPEPARHSSSTDLPSQDFALQFARAYLTYDPTHAGRRERALAPFVPEGLESGGGAYLHAGPQRVLWEEIASDQPALAGGQVITVAAGVSTQRLPLYLAVTVRHERGEPLSLVGYPAFIGAPSLSRGVSESSRETVSDPAVKTVVERALRNYLQGQGQNLAADLTADAVITLPTLALHERGFERLEWTSGPGSAVLATLSAEDQHGSSYTLTYELGIAYRERPYVDFIEVIPTAT